VVLLGAGFDARGLRMPEIEARKAAIYEVRSDHAVGSLAHLPPELAHEPGQFA